MRVVWKDQPAGTMLLKLGDAETLRWRADAPGFREGIRQYVGGRFSKRKSLVEVIVRASAHLGAEVLDNVLRDASPAAAPEPDYCEEVPPHKREAILARVRAHAARARQYLSC